MKLLKTLISNAWFCLAVAIWVVIVILNVGGCGAGITGVFLFPYVFGSLGLALLVSLFLGLRKKNPTMPRFSAAALALVIGFSAGWAVVITGLARCWSF
jgi:hypothetical protein